jgi:PHO85 cyclin-1
MCRTSATDSSSHSPQGQLGPISDHSRSYPARGVYCPHRSGIPRAGPYPPYDTYLSSATAGKASQDGERRVGLCLRSSYLLCIIIGLPCTRHRVFLATLIVASKYLNDASPRNRHWQKFAVIFDLAEVNLMEKQLLFLLDYDLRFDEPEVCHLFEPFMEPLPPRNQEARKKVLSVVAQASRVREQAQTRLPPTPPRDHLVHPPAAKAPVSEPSSHVPPTLSIVIPNTAQNLTDTVQKVAKRLGSTYLSHASAPAPCGQPLRGLSTPPSAISTSTSGDSEAGSATESSSYSSDDYFSDDDAPEPSESSRFLSEPDRCFPPRSAPAAVLHRRGRTASVASDATIEGGIPCIEDTSLGLRPARGSKITSSRTAPVGFLSRMWGAATKVAAQHTYVESEALHPSASAVASGVGAFQLRKLAHSRSTMFRGSARGDITDV